MYSDEVRGVDRTLERASMKAAFVVIGLLSLLGCVAFVACGTVDGPGGGVVVGPPSSDGEDSGADEPITESPGGDATGETPGVDGGESPSAPDSDSSSNRPTPDAGITVRVRNESAYRADVTLRFIQDEVVSHLAFVRVLPDTVTAVVSPGLADRLELSGVDERARALPAETLTYGVDFDEDTPAEYVIPREAAGDDSPGADDYQPPAIQMLEPATDTVVRLGATLVVRWKDDSHVPGTVVRVSLRLADGDTLMTPIGPAVGAALDGLNDELAVVLEGVDPGVYEVVGEIDDGTTLAASTAPGRVEVEVDPGNAAPMLSITSPTTRQELHDGDTLVIRWEDADEDDNATITFSLVASDPAVVGVGPYGISPALAEDPDGDAADRVTVTIGGVLPGTYDLVGTIDDGRLRGTARVQAAVRVLPEVANDPPQLALWEPASDFEMMPGESFLVRWTDSDGNDNAMISLLLDPDLDTGALDGDEVLLVSSLGENPDGLGDEITLGVPQGVSKGKYRLAGSITDGVSGVVTWARGIIYFGVSTATEPDEEQPPPPPPPPPPSLMFREPSAPPKVRLGDTIPFQLDAANLPVDANVRLTLSNMPYGGAVSVDVTPATLVLNATTTLALPTSVEAVRNDAWPRRFDLTAKLVVGGTTYGATAPAPVWIRQEVEVRSVEMVNYTCQPGSEPVGDEREFTGLEIVWYGGGFEEREIHAEVEFWVSNDGTIPADGEGDARHWITLQTLESPNIERTQRVPVFRVLGPVLTGDILRFGLLRGDYQIITAVEPSGFGRIVSGPHPHWIQVCLRASEH